MARRVTGGTGPGGPKRTGTGRKTAKKTRRTGRGRKAAPLPLRTAKVLDAIFKALEESAGTQIELSMNDRKVLERIKNRFTRAVTNPLTEADISNAKRIARKAGIQIPR